MKSILFLYVFCILIYSADFAKILAIFPMAARSHYILGSTYLRELAERGHDVTMISPFKEKNPPKNGSYRDIQLTGFVEMMEKRKMNFFDRINIPSTFLLFVMNAMSKEIVSKSLEHHNVQELLKSGEKFDLVVMEQFFNDAHQYFAYHFNAPLILFSTVGANQMVNSMVGNPAPPAAVADLMLSYTNHMSFFQRVCNTLVYVIHKINRHCVVIPTHRSILKELFPTAPDLDSYMYNASLVFLNSHPSLGAPVALVPSMIEIGGFHVKPPNKLPKDLQKFMDDAKEGVIYFSMGSNLKSKDLPPEKLDMFLKTFASLKCKVLWKWENEILPGQPPNVKLAKWLPQPDVLAHPNLKLFITHGGLLSTTETIYHGIPVLAIPVFGDQKLNAANAVNNGYGITVSLSSMTQEKLTDSINEILDNPRYNENVKLRSKLFHDRPSKPMDTAVFWTEYVIRHKGAPHLRVAEIDLAWHQYILLDVMAFLVLTIGLFIYIFTKFIQMLCRTIRNKTVKTAKKLKKP